MCKSYRSKILTRASPEGSARSSCRRQREAGGTARGREARNKRHRAMRSKDKAEKIEQVCSCSWVKMSNINFLLIKPKAL